MYTRKGLRGTRNPGHDNRSPPGWCFIGLLTNIQPSNPPALLETTFSQSTGGNIRLGEINRTSAAHSASPGRLFPQGLLQLPLGLPLAKPGPNVPLKTSHSYLDLNICQIQIDGWKQWDEYIHTVAMVSEWTLRSFLLMIRQILFRNALINNKWRKWRVSAFATFSTVQRKHWKNKRSVYVKIR